MAKYACKQRGYRLALPEGMTFNGKLSILFNHTEPSIETDDPKLIEFIENHDAFLRQTILRIPTPAEVAEIARVEKANNTLRVLKDMVGRPGVSLNFRAMNKGELNQIAQDLNVDINGLSTEELIGKLEVLVFGERVTKAPAAPKVSKSQAKPKQEGD